MPPHSDLPPPMNTRRHGLPGLPTSPSTALSATSKPPAARPKPSPKRPSRVSKAKKPPLAKQKKAPSSKSATAIAAADQSQWDAQIQKDNEEDVIAAAQEEALRLEHQSFYEKYRHMINMDSQDISGELGPLQMSPGGKERYDKALAEAEKTHAAARAAAAWDEFKTVGYSVEWLVHFEKIELFRDSTTHTIGGEERLDWELWYTKLHAKGPEYADSEGKSCYTVAIKAELRVGNIGGKATATINLMEGELDSVWQRKVLSQIRLRHESRPQKRISLTFKISVDFWFARTANGVIPPSMLPVIPLTQSQIKAQQAQAKAVRVDLLNSQQQALVNNEELELIRAYKCTSHTCPNSTGGQCLLQDGVHYALDAPHIRAWVQCINRGTATPSSPPPNFHITARLRRLAPYGKDRKQKQEDILPPTTPAPVGTATDVMEDKHMDRVVRLATLKLIGKLIGDDVPATLTPQSTPAPPPASTRIPSPLLPPPRHRASSSRSRALSHLPDADAPRPSSPVSTDDWSGYIYWCCNIENKFTGIKKEAFEHAGRILEEGMVTIQSIQLERKGLGYTQWWETMTIKPGVGHYLARNASKYEAFEERQRAIRQCKSSSHPSIDYSLLYTRLQRFNRWY